jgi:hypothetical protein
MTDMKKRLVVMDPEGRLPADLLQGLSPLCDVVPCRSEGDLQDLLQSGPWHGAVIADDSRATTALAVARRVKRLNPASTVILMGPLPADGSSRAAFDAGVDVIVSSGEYADLYAAIVTRMSPSLPDAPRDVALAPSPGAPGAALTRHA